MIKTLVTTSSQSMKIEKGYHLATSSAAEAQQIRKMKVLLNTEQRDVRKRLIFQ